jgi:retinol dehydrogenase 12
MTNMTDLHGKTALVTGATAGIGRVTAETLAKMGANVILVGRSPNKLNAAVAEIRSATGNPRVDGLVADLSSQASVRQLAEEYLARFDQLHILVNNAGAFFARRHESVDGIEMTFALNHLAYFLLTDLLLERIKASTPARIVNVSSGAHVAARLNLDDLENKRSFSGWKAYGESKLANIYFTYELARRLDGSGVTVNALHPGFVATNFGISNGGLLAPLFRIFQMGAISPQEGAQTTLYLASSPEVAGVTGQYFDRSKPVRSSAVSYDQETARRLWAISAQMTGNSQPVSV